MSEHKFYFSLIFNRVVFFNANAIDITRIPLINRIIFTVWKQSKRSPVVAKKRKQIARKVEQTAQLRVASVTLIIQFNSYVKIACKFYASRFNYGLPSGTSWRVSWFHSTLKCCDMWQWLLSHESRLSHLCICLYTGSRIVRDISDGEKINAKKIFCFHVIELECVASSFEKRREQQRSKSG